MFQSIHECSREERLERALLAIEMLAYLNDNSEDETLGKIYSIAHAAHGRCCTAHKLDLITEAEAAGIEHNLYDVCKILEKEIKQ